MRPMVAITIDGNQLSIAAFSRLISVTVQDRVGMRSDTIDLEFEALGFAIPRDKAIITAQFGYSPGYGMPFVGDFVDFGSFTADDITLSTYPHKIQVQGKSASMHAGLKEQKERHWDKKSARDVYGKLAKENGLSLQIDPKIGKIKRDWWGQENVSAIHYARQLAEEMNADLSIKDKKMLITQKGAGLSAAGASVGKLIVKPEMHIEGSMSVKFKGREKHAKVEAEYHDKDKAKRKRVSVKGHPDGTGTHRMRQQFPDKEQAEAAASSRATNMSTRADTTEVTLEGTPAARGGGNMAYSGFHSQVDGVPFVIDSASHTYNKDGSWQVGVSAKSKAK